MIDFVSPTVGWLAPEYDQISPPIFSALFRTRDSGKTWTEIGPGPSGFPLLLGFAAPDRAYGYNPSPADSSCCHNSDFTGFPVVSRDGGKSWPHRPVPIPAGYSKDAFIEFGGVGFSGARAAAIPVQLSEPGVGGFCTTYHTNDGGARWWYTSLNHKVCGLYFLDAMHGWGWGNVVDGQPTVLYRTVDGGSRWVSLGRSEFASTGAFYFVTPLVGFGYSYSEGYRRFARTIDGGKTWKFIDPQMAG